MIPQIGEYEADGQASIEGMIPRMADAKILGHTQSGKPVPTPTRGAPDTNDVMVFRKTKAKFPGWTRADHMDASRLLDLAAEEAERQIGGGSLAQRYRRWSAVHWDVGGRWTGPEFDAYLARRGEATPKTAAEIEADIQRVRNA